MQPVHVRQSRRNRPARCKDNALRSLTLSAALSLQLLSLACDADKSDSRWVQQAPPTPREPTAEEERAARVAAEAAVVAAREAKIRDDSLKSVRRHCMSLNEIEAFLWVKMGLFARATKGGETPGAARARAEIAAARVFGLEPANWAKRDFVLALKLDRQFRKERDDVEQRWKAAMEHSRDVESDLINKTSNKDFNPLKNAVLYWSQDARRKDPNNPLSIAFEEEKRIEYEREQVYHKYGKETPEERAGGAIAILLTMGMIGAEGAGLSGEAEAAMTSLGDAEAALTLGESRAALASVLEARAILTAAEEAQTAALTAVREARTALVAGEVETAAVAVRDAQAALSEILRTNPAAALAVAALDEAEAKLDAADKADIDLGQAEKETIDLFNDFETNQDDARSLLAEDLAVANNFAAEYNSRVTTGQITPTQGGDKVMRKGCHTAKN